jgi:NADH dehydrogenase
MRDFKTSNLKELNAVTGAFGFAGKYITIALLEKGIDVLTLTNSPGRENTFGDKIIIRPLNFDNYDELVNSLKGVSVLYNTYWIRFNYSKGKLLFQHAQAAKNTVRLFQAAKEAGVKHIVHISIANPSEDSPYEYYMWKAKLEKSLSELGVQYTIIRPAVIFGKEDILINNLAWSLRKLPVFAVFGTGQYKLQPVFVEDLAKLAIESGQSNESITIDAAGPELYTYSELIKMLCRVLHKKRIILKLPTALVYYSSKIIDLFTGDILLTKDEINMVKDNLMYSKHAPLCKTKLSEWCAQNLATLGTHYASEIARRKNRNKSYI